MENSDLLIRWIASTVPEYLERERHDVYQSMSRLMHDEPTLENTHSFPEIYRMCFDDANKRYN